MENAKGAQPSKGLSILPPPLGLDLDEISTESGLHAAIGREAKALDTAKKNRTPVAPDTVRLITFLANEIQRRIHSLSPEQKDDLQDIRIKARILETERKVQSISDNVLAFIEAINTPKSAIRFSAINELEDQVASMIRVLGKAPENYAKLLQAMDVSSRSLEDVKNKGKVFSGFTEF
ncbi:MAG: hypothetical protein JKY92_01375 [Magnetovibrio sp.]|nr:hypothetical protein [Magnetovibrio sp.]